MKNIFNIVKKELDKIFTNPKLIFTTFLLSPILLYVIYSMIGNISLNESEKQNNETIKIGIINVEENDNSHIFMQSIQEYSKLNNIDDVNNLGIEITFYDKNITSAEIINDKSEIRTLIEETVNSEEIDMWIYYEEDFSTKLEKLKTDIVNMHNKEYPKIGLYYNSYKNKSSLAMVKINSIIDIQKQLFFNELDLNSNIFDLSLTKDLITNQEEKNVALKNMAMILPMLIIIFIFSGGMAIGADLIAGEKERGTIATLLMTPISKNEIILGKIFSGIILTIISAICSTIGMIFSVKNLMSDEISTNMKISFTFGQIFGLFIVILVISLLAISLFLFASTYASNVKEATMYIMPIYIVAMVISLLVSLSFDVSSQIGLYVIPIYNVALSIKGILINQISSLNIFITSISTIIYFIVILFITTKLFKSEKIMFAK